MTGHKTNALLAAAVVTTIGLGGCSADDDPPWLNQGQRDLYSEENIQRDARATDALRERARRGQADR